MRFKALVPMLQTNDMSRTRLWYETILGFRCVSAQGDEWCRLARDDVAIMFMRNAHLGDPHATATQYIYVDGCHGRLELYQGPLLGRVGSGEDALWNARVRGQRPDGYLISFGQHSD